MPVFSPEEAIDIFTSGGDGLQDQIAAAQGVSPLTDGVIQAALDNATIAHWVASREELDDQQRTRMARWAIRRLANDIHRTSPHPGALVLREMYRLFRWRPGPGVRRPLVEELLVVEGNDVVFLHFNEHLSELEPLFSNEELAEILEAHPNMQTLARRIVEREESLPEPLIEQIAEMGADSHDRHILRELAKRSRARQNPRVRYILLQARDPETIINTLPDAGSEEGQRAVRETVGSYPEKFLRILEERGTDQIDRQALTPLLRLEDQQHRKWALRLMGEVRKNR